MHASSAADARAVNSGRGTGVRLLQHLRLNVGHTEERDGLSERFPHSVLSRMRHASRGSPAVFLNDADEVEVINQPRRTLRWHSDLVHTLPMVCARIAYTLLWYRALSHGPDAGAQVPGECGFPVEIQIGFRHKSALFKK